MRISASLGTGLDPAQRDATSGVLPEAEEPLRASLPAIVPGLDGRATAGAPLRVRPVATLLAQLVAGAEDLPSSRARRRADPGASAEVYRSVARLGPVAPRPPSRLF